MGLRRDSHAIGAVLLLALLLAVAAGFVPVTAANDIGPSSGPDAASPSLLWMDADASSEGKSPILADVDGPEPINCEYGLYLTNVGDVNGDNCDDILIKMDWQGGTTDWGPCPLFRLLLGCQTARYDQCQYYPLEQDRGIVDMGSLGDVNGDGLSDLWSLLIRTEDHTPFADLYVWYGAEGGVPHPPVSLPLVPDDHINYTDAVWVNGVGDVNGDGYDDCLVLIREYKIPDPVDPRSSITIPSDMKLYEGSPEGLRRSPSWNQSIENLATTYPYWYVTISHADVNGDGCQDLCQRTSGQVNLWMYLGSRTDIFNNDPIRITITEKISYGVYDHSFAPIVMDSDGCEDYAFGCMGLREYENGPLDLEHQCLFTVSGSQIEGPDASSTLFELPTWPVLYNGYERPTSDIEIMDVNGDGLDDVIQTHVVMREKPLPAPGNWGPTRECEVIVDVHLNRNGTFVSTPDNTVNLGAANCSGAGGLVSGDFDGDGDKDLGIILGGYFWGVAYHETRHRLKIIDGESLMDRFEYLKAPDGSILYAGKESYAFHVFPNPTGFLRNITEVELVLDQGSADVHLSWRPGIEEGVYAEFSDPFGVVELSSSANDTVLDGRGRPLSLGFNVKFDWDWPHEQFCNVSINVLSDDMAWTYYRFKDVFRVENDLMFIGALSVEGEWQGPVHEGDWVRGGEELTFSGPRIVYEGTTDVQPPDGTLGITVRDSEYRSSSIVWASGIPVSIKLKAFERTNLHEQFMFVMMDLPAGAEDRNRYIVSLKVDADPPSFGDWEPALSQWQTSGQVRVSVNVSDQGSGVDSSSVEYQVSTTGPEGWGSWSCEGLSTATAWGMLRCQAYVPLPDGADNLIRWRARDLVGNVLEESEGRSIPVDSTCVTFSGSYHGPVGNRVLMEFEVGTTITDMNGSGVDVSTIEYRVALAGTDAYGRWTDWDEGGCHDVRSVTLWVVILLREGADNRVQWRATDVAGNGLTLSPEERILVDITPVVFSDMLPSQEDWQCGEIVTCSVRVADPAPGSGVNLTTFEFRYATPTTPGGAIPGEWSPWRRAPVEGRSDSHVVAVTVTLVHGIGNRIQFRVADMAGNGPVTSLAYAISVDLVGPEFVSITPPTGEKQRSGLVDVSVTVRDPCSGLNIGSLEHRLSLDGGVEWEAWAPLPVSPGPEGSIGAIGLRLLPGTGNVVQFRARDAVGNLATSAPHVIWVNRPPVVIIAKPTDGSELSEGATIELDGNGTYDPDGDALALMWCVLLPNGTVQDLADPRLNLPAGRYTITLIALDPVGARGAANVTIEVRKDVVKPDGRPPLALLVIAIVVAAGAYAFWYLRRRGSSRDEGGDRAGR